MGMQISMIHHRDPERGVIRGTLRINRRSREMVQFAARTPDTFPNQDALGERHPDDESIYLCRT